MGDTGTWPVVGLCVLLLVACSWAPALAQEVPKGQPLNSRCPIGVPGRWWPAMQRYVKSHPLFQEGVAEKLASSQPQAYQEMVSMFAFRMAEFCNAYMEELQLPEGAINATRPTPFTLDCQNPAFSDIFSGERRETNASILWISHFSYEVPMAIYRLYAMADLVDHFVFVESPIFQHSGIVKPLLYERLKHHFVKFHHKIEHMVLAGGQVPTRDVVNKAVSWDNEHRERQLAHKLLKHRFKDVLKPDDIVIHGDMDENPDENFVFHLKHCKLKPQVSQPINSNILFWLTDYRNVFRADDGSPGPGYPYSLLYPQVWTFEGVQQAPSIRAWHKRGQPFPKVVGGYHFCQPAFMPGAYLKYLGVSEAGAHTVFGSPLARDPAAWKAAFHGVQTEPTWRARVTHPQCIQRNHGSTYNHTLLRVPWLMANNPEVFRDYIPCGLAFYDSPEGPNQLAC